MLNGDKIISALIGLANACNSNPKTERTDAVILKALSYTTNTDCSEADICLLIDEIHAEKNAVSPNCAFCGLPCGSTSDYDMERIYKADDDVRGMKIRIISEIEKIAAVLYKKFSDGDINEINEINKVNKINDESCNALLKALIYTGSDTDADELTQILCELSAIKQKINGGF